MKVIHFPLNLNYVNVFLAFDEHSRAAFLVDCGAFPQEIKTTIKREKLDLQFLLITHTHYDHVDGISDFRKAFEVPIYSSTNTYDEIVKEEDRIPFEKSHIQVFETPGHIDDGVSYYIDGAVFVGDAIFSGAVGGTSSRAHFEEETSHVRNKIFTLPDETIIYPGHGAASVVAVERLHNPFFH